MGDRVVNVKDVIKRLFPVLVYIRALREFLDSVQRYKRECDAVIEEIEQCLEFLTVLKTDYVRVATKTTSLHEACENLLEDQVNSFITDIYISNLINY